MVDQPLANIRFSTDLVPKGEEPGLEMTTALPQDAKTNDAGVPHYLGLTGNKLITAITATATTVSSTFQPFWTPKHLSNLRRPKAEGLLANAFVCRPFAGFPAFRI